MAQVRIPHSTLRRQLTYALLIRRVRPLDTWGTAFEGDHFRTGTWIDDAQLRPDPSYPRTPLLVENAGIAHAGRGHKRSTHLFILWRWDAEPREWRELVRTTARGCEWVEVVKSVALRELSEPCERCFEIAAQAAARVMVSLDYEIAGLTPEPRRELIGMLYEKFTARMVDMQP